MYYLKHTAHPTHFPHYNVRKLIVTYRTSDIMRFSLLSLDDSTSDKHVPNFVDGYLRKETKFRAESYLSLRYLVAKSNLI